MGEMSDNKVNVNEHIDSNIFRSLFEKSLSGILYGNPDGGNIYDANQAAADMFGYTIEELRKLNRNDIFDFNHRSMVSSLASRKENGSAKGELIGIRKNGEYFPCEFSSSIYKNEKGEYRTSTILNDISQRKQSEEEIALFLNNTEESFVFIDKEFKIVYFNKRFSDIYFLNFKKEVVKNESIFDYAMPGRREVVIPIFNKVLKGEIHEYFVEKPADDNKSLFYHVKHKPARDFLNNVIGIFISTRDVTEQKKIEKEMKLLLDNTEESFVLVNKQLNIVSFNKKFASNLKYFFNADAIKGVCILNFSQTEKRSSDEEIYLRVFNGETIEVVITVPNQNNDISYFNYKYKPALDNNGNIIGAFVTSRDITEKRKAIQAKEFEQRNKEALINTTEDLLWSVDSKFQFIAGNCAFLKTMERTAGLNLKSGDNMLLRDNFNHDFINSWEKFYRRALTGESFIIEICSPKEVGDVVCLETRFNPIYNGNIIIGVACYSRDVTESKKAYQQLKENKEEIKRSHDQLSKLTDSIETIVYQFEMSTDGKMTFPFISKSVNKLVYGLDLEALKHDAAPAFETVHPKDREELLTSIVESRDKLTDWKLEFRYIMPDGTIKWIKGSSHPFKLDDGTVVWYGYLLDVTQRKVENEQLRIANKRYHTISKATNDTIWDIDYISNTITWNDGIETIFGYSENEPRINDPNWWYSKIHPDDVTYVKQQSDYWLKTKKNRWEFEYRFLCANNTYKHVFDRGFLLTDENGNPYRMIGAMQDVTDRKEIEKENKNILNLLNRTSELAKIGGWEVDLINNKHYWSPEINNILELEKIFSPTIDKIILFFVPQHRYIIKNAIHNAVHEGLDWDFELEANTSTGKSIWLRVQCYPLRVDNKTIKLLGTLQDITERKNIAEQLKDTNLKFKTIIDSAPECIKLINKSGELVLINQAGLDMLELESLEMLSQQPLDSFVVPKYRSESNKLFENGFKGIEGTLEFELITRKGNRIWVEAKVVSVKKSIDEVDSILVVTRDITKRKKEEQHLKLLESVITNTSDSIMITEAEPFDEPGPKIVFVNEAFTKMTGYTSDEVIGKSPRFLQGPNTSVEELKKLSTSMRKWKPSEATVLNYKKNGEPFWNNISIKPIADENGWFTHWISVERDVTQQMNNDLEREHIITELSQNNKDLKHFSYVISHNLRAPIANLLGLTNLIDHYKVPSKSLKQIFDGIKQSALMFDDTIKDLTKVLVVKDQTSIVKENVVFVDVIDKVLKQLSISVNDNAIKINYEFKNAPYVSFSESYAESILLNLFTNAIKYQSPKRKLKIDIVTDQVDDFIELKFTDNGIGIDTERHKEKLFKLYQRFHDNPDGKGLGLYLIKSQIEALGGSIDVESEIGKGTTFILKFKKTDLEIE